MPSSIATYRMLCCTNPAMARAFATLVEACAVRATTFDFISALDSVRPVVRLRYHVPICCQFEKEFGFAPPEGRNDSTARPITPRTGGMSSSVRTAFCPVTLHCHWFGPPCDGLISDVFSHVTLYSQLTGNCRE